MRNLEKVYKASVKLLTPLGLQETYKEVVEEAGRLLGSEYGSVLLEDDSELVRVYASDPFLYNYIPRKKGFTNTCFTEKKSFTIGSRQLWPVHPDYKDRGIKSVVFVPLIYADRSIGVLTLQSTKEKKIDQDKLRLAKMFGLMASAAIRKAQLYDEARLAVQAKDYYKTLEHTLERIYVSGLKFLAPLDINTTYKVITQEAINLVGAEHGSILLAEKGELVRVYASSKVFFKIKPRKRGLIYQAYKSGRSSILKPKVIGEVQSRHPALKLLAPRAILFVPLLNQDKPMGILTVQSSKSKKLSDRELQMLTLFGSMASLAIRKAHLYTEVKAALETRDLFIAMAAHELRTPLTAITTYAHLLNKKIQGDTIEAKWAKELRDETQRLTRLLNDLLAINSIKKGELSYRFETHDINLLTERAVIDFRFNYPNHQVLLTKSKNKSMVLCDGDKIIQVFTNILNNAGKFTKEGKKISVNVTSDKTKVEISIKDQGRGIPKKDIGHIFEGFYKGEGGYEEGMGLGLYLTKEILDRHKGTIAINSRLGKGTSVTVTLPKVAYAS